LSDLAIRSGCYQSEDGAIATLLFPRQERPVVISEYPIPGTLVDVGGYRLHARVAGTGTPAVVMDSGLGANSILYAGVLPKVARFTTACAFDRAGYPWSDAAPAATPRTAQRIVQEVRAMLRGLGLPAPYVLVGLSFGAINMLTYALRYPAEVSGIAFVEPSLPEMFDRVPGVPSGKRMAQSMGMAAALARCGLLRPFGKRFARTLAGGWNKLPPEAFEAQAIFGVKPEVLAAAAHEAQASGESFAGARAPQGALGDLPLVVLSGAEAWKKGRRAKSMGPAMLALREELARLSSTGRHILVDDGGHTLTVDQPDAVVTAIHTIVEAARSRAVP
jgi:pimeloyl-ACP methyl ester carboxylesterase